MRSLPLVLALLLAACGDSRPASPGGSGGAPGGGGAGGTGGSLAGGSGGGGSGGGDGGSGGSTGGSGGAEGGSGGGGAGGVGGMGGEGGAPIGMDARPANATCLAGDPPGTGKLGLQRAWPALSFQAPVLALQAPGDADHVYVVEQRGLVKRFAASDDAAAADTALDISDHVKFDGAERGLLGMAFHPAFADNGEAFLSYTLTVDGQMLSHVTRIFSTDGGATFDPATEELVLEVKQPYTNHNGGNIAFGPDGFLYVGFGDGGSGGDPQGNAQKTTTLLGKMVRLDVDAARPYAIPDDNPFAGGEDPLPEIWALGLRNPWRWSFDRQTGRLFAGDVGQNAVEEIDIVERGKNYGWNVQEGTDCYRPASGCDPTGLEQPIHEYRHGSDGFSVTGGHVYRGSKLPELAGAYVFADYGSGKIWSLRQGGDGAWASELLVDAPFNVPSFGELSDGELLVIDFGGALWRLAITEVSGGPPELLSQTGCFDRDGPAPGLIPYDINVHFWSDGADKARWMALPDGATATVSNGHVDLPPGSVLVKDFHRGGRHIETRLLSRRSDGTWSGVSYVWLEDGSDARISPKGETLDLADGGWVIPSTGECAFCHTAAAGRSLGLDVVQMNRRVTYAGDRVGDQLATLAHVGVLELADDPRTLPALPSSDAAPLADRARAYLHANCSMCHRPQGGARGFQDLRWDAPDMKVCDAQPVTGSLGITDARIVAPGDPARSVMSKRIHSRDPRIQMPPLGSLRVDDAGAALIDAWITSLTGCE